MSESRAMVIDMADALFADVAQQPAAEAGTALDAAGFSTLLHDEARGGFGGDFGDLFAIAKCAGRHALAYPIVEAIIASALIDRAGLDVPPGAVRLAHRADGSLDGDRFTGKLVRVPWGREATHVVAQLEDRLLLIDVADAVVDTGESPAGEPRDTLVLANAVTQSAPAILPIMHVGALARTGQIAGAIDAALAMAIDHANQRQQFGRPLAKFQAVQQNLATLAVEAAAVNCAGAAAAAALDAIGDAALLEVGSAKLRANLAVGTGCAVAHQIHGAIGFTQEYPLHRLTRRMMGWRSEFGADRHWAERLGVLAATAGGVGLWQVITDRGDRT